MATTTSPMEYTGSAATTTTATPARGFFGRMFDRFVSARTRHAQVQVQAYLARLSDARLKDLGFSVDETKALREKGRIPASYWG
ncbi:MAG: hypothetical protein ABI391_08185 [Hyphomicrobiaceae bacterium]